MTKFFSFCLCILSSFAHAEILVADKCFVNYYGKERSLKMLMKTYFDTEIKQPVGGLVEYSSSGRRIPLVFVDTIASDEGFEDHWLEVSESKVTGEYVYQKSGVGSGISGYSLTYKNFRTGKKTIFSLSSDGGSECMLAPSKK